ncbi:MAG: hypothetical protein V3V08_06305 [Nannocystaceae bacterium]
MRHTTVSAHKAKESQREVRDGVASEQRVAVRSLLEASKRLPQEFIGTDVLAELEE